MRLRLRIERNALPTTQVLYPIRDPKSTVAQLLASINEIFPLESDTWGLEDYSILIAGYECLHYHVLEEICREDDEVVVKALQYVDVRARTMAGRDQITADGRHLVDGVPWGRPCLRGPVRPEIRIPPRKKRKVLVDGEEVGAGVEAGPLMLMENGEVDEDEDSSDDEDEDFAIDESEDESAWEDSSSDSESGDNDDSDTSSDTSDPESDSEDTSDSESEEAGSWQGIPATPQRKTTKKSATGAVVTQSSNTPGAKAESKRKRQAEDGSISKGAPDHQRYETEVAKQRPSIPFEGRDATKTRNARRRDAKVLKNLISTGVLPKDATLAMARYWKNGKGDTSNEGAEKAEASSAAAANGENGTTDAANHTLSGADENEERGVKGVKKAKEVAKTDEQRQNLLSDIASGGIDVTEQRSKRSSKRKRATLDNYDEPPQELSSKPLPEVIAQAVPADANGAVAPTIDKPAAMVPLSVARRSKLDLAGSKRMLFGSLGVRVPKTQEEKDELQKKLAERPRKKVFSTGRGSVQLNGGALFQRHPDQGSNGEDPKAWREKINLTAVECCDEGVMLSTPPFPFHQRWDPQQKKKKANKRINGMYMDGTASKKRKRDGQILEHLEERYDKYNADGYGDALDYDDAEEDGYWEEGALLDGEYDGEDGDAAEENGFPTLPAEMNEMKVLGEDEAQKGDFITFAELACDESTGWQPKTVRRTAKLVERPSAMTNADGKQADHWIIQLSMGDRKVVEYDEEGTRVYKKFDMPGVDDEADGMKDLLWTDMGEVRLVSRPQQVEDVE